MHIIILRLFGFMRLKQLAQKNRLMLILYNYALSMNVSYIGKDATFQSLPNFPHGIKSIFISGESKIGSNVTIFQCVTIGSNMLIDSKSKGGPIIGNDCYIGAGAKIIGDITIGDNCRIGANVIVSESIPKNSLVVSEKSKVIVREIKMDNTFYFKMGDGWGRLNEGKKQKITDGKIINKLNL